jgi:hypothetical protein
MLIESFRSWLIFSAETVCCQPWNVWTQDEIINQPAFQSEQSTISRFGLSKHNFAPWLIGPIFRFG